MRPHGSAEELERRRRRGVALLQKGHGVREVARMVGVTPGAVVAWRKAYEKKGEAGLAAKPHPGRKPKLSLAQRKKLIRLMKKGPQANGYKTDLWTLPRVAEVIRKRFSVRYDPSHVWRILNAMSWSAQKPERRARERDEQGIARWRKKDWPRIKKARRTGHSIVLLDESGFMLQPVVRRTWAPRGQTPIQYSWDRRDRLSAISAITVSPQVQRLGLYFDIFDHNIVTDDFEMFVAAVLRRLGRPIILVMDRWQVHRAGAHRLLRRFPKRVRIEWLPAYAPELNPVEQVWNRTKYTDLANYIPDDVLTLGHEVARSIRQTRSQQTLLHSFFRHCGLGL